MLTVTNLIARIDDRTIFDGVSFSLNAGDVLGVIGPNGSGKSTLLAAITGERPPASGTVSTMPGVRIGHLRQGFADRPDGTLGDLVDVPSHGLLAARQALDEAALALAEPAATDAASDAAMARYVEALDAFERAGGYAVIDRLTALMGRLGVGPDALGRDWDTPLAELSGGQKTRAGLAALLAWAPDVLVLDEPTNHLDNDAAAVVEDLVLEHRGATLVVSHDRAFLDRVATRVLALDDLETGWEIHAGGYTDFLEAKVAEAEEQESAWHRQQETVARVERDIRKINARGQQVEGKIHVVTNRWMKYARLATVRKRRLERMLDSEDHVEKPAQRWGLSVELPAPPPGGRDVAMVDGLTVRLGGHEVLRGASLHVRAGERVALLGANGSGKTTLIRALLGDIAPDAGTVRLGGGVVVGRFAQEQETLRPGRSVLDHVRDATPVSEADARTFLHRFLFSGDAPLRAVGTLSYGERARLALALVVLRGANFLVLDEPLNHLDLGSREEFEEALAGYTGTSLMVLHDRRAIERLATRRVELTGGRLVER